MAVMDDLEREAQRLELSFDMANADPDKLKEYMDIVGVEQAYTELYESYEGLGLDKFANRFDTAFFVIGNRVHQVYEDKAPFWVDLLAEQRESALRVSAFQRRITLPRRIYSDYRSGLDYPQDLYITD